jgi:carbonic anhydrase/acetyltransferase-like protein (isoleucine patch superfamily)
MGEAVRMLIEHRGKRPDVHPTAYVAPTAVLCGDVRIGPDARVLFGAVVTAEDGWVAVGTPARILPPDRHDDIWAVQEGLDFPGTVYGVPRGTDATTLMRRQSAFYGAHADDSVIAP